MIGPALYWITLLQSALLNFAEVNRTHFYSILLKSIHSVDSVDSVDFVDRAIFTLLYYIYRCNQPYITEHNHTSLVNTVLYTWPGLGILTLYSCPLYPLPSTLYPLPSTLYPSHFTVVLFYHRGSKLTPPLCQTILTFESHNLAPANSSQRSTAVEYSFSLRPVHPFGMPIVPWGQTGAVGLTDKTLLVRKGCWSRNVIYEIILKVVEAMKNFISKFNALQNLI